VKFKTLPKSSTFVRFIESRYVKLPGRWKSIIFDRTSLKAIKQFKPDVFINSLYQSNLPSPTPKSIYICMFPQKLKPERIYDSSIRKVYNSLTNVLEAAFVGSREKAIDSYALILANSNYTAGWIQKYWNKKATVLYPVCDNMGPSKKKKNVILSVGRFFADNGSSHHKKHDELIKAFKRLDRDDWELHIAGSLPEDKDSLEYFDSLKELSKGQSNIYLHPNMPFSDLKDLRQHASIYWHATGYGYSSDLYPENQEHFGMVTAEAMSAGAVPVVYNSAGQKEVVIDAVNGFLWNDLDELIEKTALLIDNNKIWTKLHNSSIKRADDFSRDVFVKNLDVIFSKL
jgi:glycosyltransferase involved in cell wall biosynthesis